MSEFENLSIPMLKKECEDSGIILENPRMSKKQIIGRLCRTRETLVLGLPSKTDIGVKRCFLRFTGVRDREDITWGDLTVRKIIPSGTFDDIIIYDCKGFFTVGGEMDTRKVSSCLDVLEKNGCVKVLSTFTDVITYLKKNRGFKFFMFQEIIVNGEEFIFDILSTVQIAESPKKRVGITYPIEIKKYKKTSVNEKFLQEEDIEICLEAFRQKLDSDDFIKDFSENLKKLYSFKLNFYEKKLKEVKNEFDSLCEKSRLFKLRGVSNLTFREMYPMFDYYTGYIVNLEILTTKIKKSIDSINEGELRQNLINCLDNDEFGLKSIIGRDKIKNNLVRILYSFSKNYKVWAKFFNNICLVGSSGVGKTNLAKVIAYVCSESGLFLTGSVKVVSRADLVGQYIGQTAPRTRGILLESLEGVLFIDEAYQLTSSGSSSKDFGSECITEIVNFLDKYVGMMMIIVAGYKKEMKESFFPSNEGLKRRFPIFIELEDYSPRELTNIAVGFLEDSIHLSTHDQNYIYSMIVFLMENNKNFLCNQAGDALNLSNFIVRSIFSSDKITWGKEEKSNEKLIDLGFKNFIISKLD